MLSMYIERYRARKTMFKCISNAFVHVQLAVCYVDEIVMNLSFLFCRGLCQEYQGVHPSEFPF